ncbi:MAG: RecX family transcriptional regulator [Oscillospiraceae bacterium]|jgi:regulatory protein|nr:RecX family transcriptional regulator [Oscillospiraceae bacterium]
MHAALLYLREHARTEREMRDKLEKKGFDAEVVSYIVTRLRATGLLDDARFAIDWAQARARKAIGSRRVRQELRVKGVSDADADAAIIAMRGKDSIPDAEFDDSGEYDPTLASAIAFARRGLSRLSGQPAADVRRKLTQSLVRRGYGFTDARSAVSSAMLSAADADDSDYTE